MQCVFINQVFAIITCRYFQFFIPVFLVVLPQVEVGGFLHFVPYFTKSPICAENHIGLLLVLCFCMLILKSYAVLIKINSGTPLVKMKINICIFICGLNHYLVQMPPAD